MISSHLVQDINLYRLQKFSAMMFNSYYSNAEDFGSYRDNQRGPHYPYHLLSHSGFPCTTQQLLFAHSLQYSLPRYSHSGYLASLESVEDPRHEVKAESQESGQSLLSESVIPPLEGFLNVTAFDQLMNNYLDNLSVKKQDKALIHAQQARVIKRVLLHPKNTTIESAKFRYTQAALNSESRKHLLWSQMMLERQR
ncbi:hypothetical protein AJ78_08527 [Emergomyces pasteurianus Ep9510]|uniref:Uncharacterized protein n=1 Tax=Emergomyces pasteurianus Ep9510 TaxID=1447872 RepID=A0A1J9Q5Q4_9EURO|nr:hypothetical protein AJ78_08527 [Emergomyces pasteurianus Ep9510]